MGLFLRPHLPLGRYRLLLLCLSAAPPAACIARSQDSLLAHCTCDAAERAIGALVFAVVAVAVFDDDEVVRDGAAGVCEIE